MLKPFITVSFTLQENFVKKVVNLNHGWHHCKPRIRDFPLPKFVSAEPKSDAKNGRLCSGDLQTNKQKTVSSLDHVLLIASISPNWNFWKSTRSRPIKCGVMNVCICCHGSKVYKATK